MLVRIVLASADPVPDALLAYLPVRPEVLETSFGHQATAIVDVEDPQLLRDALLRAAGNVAVGVIEGALATQSAKAVMLDVDSTLTTTEAIDLLAEHAGKGEQVAEITERAMRGELDFAASLEQRVATLEGLPVSVLDEVAPRMTLSDGARRLILDLHAAGVWTGVTSGGFIQLVEPLAEELGIEFASANKLEIDTVNGHQYLTGRVVGSIVDADHKARDLAAFTSRLGVSPDLAIAVGDGANDLEMLAAAGLGIAYCAKPVTAAQADVAISFPRLDAVAAFALAPTVW